MWFAILGPLLVNDGRAPVAVPDGQQRALLAALLLHAGNPVAAGTLAEVVWDGKPPPDAAGILRAHVLGLRRALGPRAGARLETLPDGYLLAAGEDEVDVLRLRSLVQDGGAALRDGAWAPAHVLLAKAAALWRGDLLDGISSESLRRDAGPELYALKLQAEEWRIDAALHLGRHAEVLPDLQSLISRYPLREAFHGQLMLALHRGGRTAGALAAYQHARNVLLAGRGDEPGPVLQDLHQRILSVGTDLNQATPARAAEGQDRGITPRELPPALPGFTGRAAQLETLTAMLDAARPGVPGTVVISAIGGTAGVGKTTLALHWAHQVAHRFPDGQLYVNMRGFDQSSTPAAPAQVIRTFLDALGVPAERIPPAADTQAALYRSLVADREMLIVLDNARDEQQVRPLLAASPASLVLITSRNQLTGLAAADGARLLNLDVLAHDEAVQLLTARISGPRATMEVDTVGEVADLCARLPLALALAAARAEARPLFPLAELAAELRDSTARLDALDAGDPAGSVTAVFSWSYGQLSSGAARMFRLLGLHPGPDISVPAAASLAAVDEPGCRRQLSELTRAHLIAEHPQSRYAFHDLLRAYAVGLARECDSQPDRDAAISRILDHYLHTASHGSMLLSPEYDQVPVAPPSPGARPERPADHRQALAWFAAEHQVLLAAVTLAAATGADRHAWQLACVMTEYLHRRGYPQERITVLTAAVAAANRLGETSGQAMSLRRLGAACTNAGDYGQARAHLEQCIPLFQALGDHLGEAWAWQNLAVTAEAQGRYTDALAHSERAGGLFRLMHHEAREAIALNNIAWFHALLGDYQEARTLCGQSLALIARCGGCDFEGAVWDTLGYIELHLGDFPKAVTHFQRALSLSRDQGARSDEAEFLTHIGDARCAAGELAQARAAWEEALAIYADIQHPGAEGVRAKLAAADG